MKEISNEHYKMEIVELNYCEDLIQIGIEIKCPYNPVVKEPKVAIVFDNGNQTRRLPLLVEKYFPQEDYSFCTIYAKYTYSLKHLFLGEPDNKNIYLGFEFMYGDKSVEKLNFTVSQDIKLENNKDNRIVVLKDQLEIMNLIEHNSNVFVNVFKKSVAFIWTVLLAVIAVIFIPVYIIEYLFTKYGIIKDVSYKYEISGKYSLTKHIKVRVDQFVGYPVELKVQILNVIYRVLKYNKIRKNRIVFISNRRSDISGNFAFVYNLIKDNKDLDIKFVLNKPGEKRMDHINAIKSIYYSVTSKVILVDDYVGLLYSIPRKSGTKMIQLWHACGAFKTFGYSRLGKPGGQKQSSVAHRNYDHCIVSSKEIAKYYAEGFGISLEKPVATGIPRTDIFFDEAYKKKVSSKFYEEYPHFKERKILFFAPTFRGEGKMSSFYPIERFDLVKLYEALGREYVIIMKYHPYIKERYEIPEEYKHDIIDMSDKSELNDLLFVTDILVSDYSSVIFEAALLDIPMLFFAYDLHEYTIDRGFYYEYEDFVPGKVVSAFDEAVEAIVSNDLEVEKIEKFKTRFFDALDGKSSERTVDFIYQVLES